MNKTKAIELARKCGVEISDIHNILAISTEELEAFYAAAEAAGEKKAIDRLTAGVEMPEAIRVQFVGRLRFDSFDAFTLNQLLEYGAAQRLLGAKEEREAADAMVGHYAEILASKREVKHETL